MARKYDSSRRTDAANRTREAILQTAFRLHGEGNLDMEALAREANVSLPTVRKYFPTRESLYEGCTSYGMHLVPMPNIEAIATTADPTARLRLAVLQVCHLHEALLGHMWSAFRMADESPALAAVTEEVENLVRRTAGLVIERVSLDAEAAVALQGVVVALLHPLAYRSFRVFGGLSPDQTIEQITTSLQNALASSRPILKEAAHI